MHKDWSLEMMLKLTDVLERDRSGYLPRVDELLDSLGMELMDYQNRGVLTTFSFKRGLGHIDRLRGKLESAQTTADVRQAFAGIDDLKNLVEDARALLTER